MLHVFAMNLCSWVKEQPMGRVGMIDDEQETIKPPPVVSGCVTCLCTTKYKKAIET